MAYLFLILSTLFWSGNFVLGRGIAEIIPPVTLGYFRWLTAFLILLPCTFRLVFSGPFVHLMPVFGTIFAIIFLGEKVAYYHLIGIILVFTGIIISTKRFGK